MWPFTRKYSFKSLGLFQGFTDCHSHILPGVDDGISTMEESIEVLKEYQKLGVYKVWLTPHIMEDIPNSTSKLRDRFQTLQEACRNTCLDDGTPLSISINLSAENMIDGLFMKRLEENDVLPYGDKGDALLMETSYVQAPYRFHQVIDEVKNMGYTPVLAHPERYQYMSFDDYDTLIAKGVRMQLNIFSLLGAYGPDARIRAEHLLSIHAYRYGGTDIHSLHNFQRMIELKKLKGDKERFVW